MGSLIFTGKRIHKKTAALFTPRRGVVFYFFDKNPEREIIFDNLLPDKKFKKKI
jgi:hypothetical protein